MSQVEKDQKVSDLIKKADLYDLIKISLKSNTNGTAVDRYIQRALERQQQSNLIIDDIESLQENDVSAIRYS